MHSWLDKSEPYFIPRLTTQDVFDKLGLIQPNEHMFNLGRDELGIDKLVSLEGLVRAPCRSDHGQKPTKYWVYVAASSWMMWNPFDHVFNEILQQMYVNPLPPDTGVYYMSCFDAGFLCGVWSVKTPSLLHFTIEDESLSDRENNVERHDENWLEYLLQPNFTYPFPKEDLFPETVRVVELPLSSHEASKLLPHTFPLPFLQIQSLMFHPQPTDLLFHFDEYSDYVQLLRRFGDYIEDRAHRKGTLYFYITEADEWYTENVFKPITGFDYNGDTLSAIHTLAFQLTAGFMVLVRIPCSWMWYIYAWYFGLGWNGEPVRTADPRGQGLGGNNMWDDMMGTFWVDIAKNLSAKSSDNAARAAMTADATG